MNEIEAMKQAILAKISANKDSVLSASKNKAELEEIRSDLQSIIGRITALKTIYNLMPTSLKEIIIKYTDVTP